MYVHAFVKKCACAICLLLMDNFYMVSKTSYPYMWETSERIHSWKNLQFICTEDFLIVLCQHMYNDSTTVSLLLPSIAVSPSQLCCWLCFLTTWFQKVWPIVGWVVILENIWMTVYDFLLKTFSLECLYK